MYATKIAEELQVNKQAIIARIEQIAKKERYTQSKQHYKKIQQDSMSANNKMAISNNTNIKVLGAEEMIIASLLRNPEYYGKIEKDISKEEFRKSIEENTLLDYVNRVKVKKGDIFFIEAGTLHAICKGILLAEVQQNSNTTYRVYDYGRLQNGKPRELHVEKALDVTSTKAIDASGKPMGETVKKDGFSETLLTTCELFTMKRLDIEEKATVTADSTSFVSLVCLEGNGVVMHGDTCVTLYKGESLFIPASYGEVEILGNLTVLESRV